METYNKPIYSLRFNENLRDKIQLIESYVYTLRFIVGLISYLGVTKCIRGKIQYNFMSESLNHIHQDTKSVRVNRSSQCVNVAYSLISIYRKNWFAALCEYLHLIKRRIFSISRIFGEKRSKP